MEGQTEFSIINLSKVDRIKNRLDAEYYESKYRRVENRIVNIGYKTLKSIEVQLDCSAFYPSITADYNFEGVGVPFLRVNEIRNGLVSISENTAFLPQNILDNNQGTIAIGYEGDIVIAKGGNTLAKLGLITNQYSHFALSRDLILVKTSELVSHNKYFVWVFFHSNYGQLSLWRTASQTGQPHLTLPSIQEIKIPIFSPLFENSFEKLYQGSLRLKLKFEKLYLKAETLLLETIGLKDFQPSQEPVNVKSFKESFGASGRLDAEYYQVKYDDYINLIKGYNNGFGTISAICNLKDTNFNPNEDTEYQYIELSNIGKSGDITGCTVAIGSELPSRARRIVNTNDVIISSIEGSLQSCALVQNDYNNALCSTGFYVINSDKINSETLLVLFKSEPMQNILKQNCSGTILTAINKTEFLNIPVPIIENTIQQKIAEFVEESFSLKTQSEKLLEVAKRAVEIAIEENEDVAMEFIKQSS